MYNDKIEALIKAALADGVLTEKEKQVLFRRAQEQGIDLDEFEMILDARVVELRKAEKGRSEKAPQASNKYGDIRKCPMCGTLVSAVAGVCHDCGYEFSGIEANKSSKDLADKIMKIEENYNDRISRVGQGSTDEWDQAWTLKKAKFSAIAQTIKSFPVPSTKADLFEFMITMQSNMLSPTTYKMVADAYQTKYNETLIKINALFQKDSMFAKFIDDNDRVLAKYKKIHWRQKSVGIKPSIKFVLWLLGGVVGLASLLGLLE